VPIDQFEGLLKLSVEFDSGPLAGLLAAASTLQVLPRLP
jgi:hypothetical protein